MADHQRPTVAERSERPTVARGPRALGHLVCIAAYYYLDSFYFPCAEPSACAELSTLLIYLDFNTLV